MFYLLGLYAAAVFFERLGRNDAAKPARDADRPPAWPSWIWPLVWMLVFGGCSVITKENHLTFPAAAILVYIFFFRGTVRRTVSAGLVFGLVVSMGILAFAAAGRREG